MITIESRKLRDLWYGSWNFCRPDHNMFHAQHCRECQKRIQAQSIIEAAALPEIYILERTEEGHPVR